MCLTVRENHFDSPIESMECSKILFLDSSGRWKTPYLLNYVKIDNGFFVPRSPSKAKRLYETIEGGFLHAYTEKGGYKNLPPSLSIGFYIFEAIAYNVVAIGKYGDLACRLLYIPAFDKREVKDMSGLPALIEKYRF